MIFHEEVHVCVHILPFPFPVNQKKRNRVKENFSFSDSLVCVSAHWYQIWTLHEQKKRFYSINSFQLCQRHTCSQGWTWQFGCDSCGCSSQIIHEVTPHLHTRIFLRGQSLCLAGALFQVIVVWFTPPWCSSKNSDLSPSPNLSVSAVQFHFSRAGLKIEALHFLILFRIESVNLFVKIMVDLFFYITTK